MCIGLFQSPCGDYVSGKSQIVSGKAQRLTQFQSPCGDYVSGKEKYQCFPSFTQVCFSPLAGIMLAESSSIDISPHY